MMGEAQENITMHVYFVQQYAFMMMHTDALWYQKLSAETDEIFKSSSQQSPQVRTMQGNKISNLKMIY